MFLKCFACKQSCFIPNRWYNAGCEALFSPQRCQDQTIAVLPDPKRLVFLTRFLYLIVKLEATCIIWHSYKNSSIQLLSELVGYLSRWPLKRWATCIILAQVAKWTMCLSAVYEMDATPAVIWENQLQIINSGAGSAFSKHALHKADASWHGAWTQAVQLKLIWYTNISRDPVTSLEQ